jgi:hypothetical protein
MKKLFCAGVCLALLLTGCSKAGGTDAALDPAGTTKALLDSGAFSETLEPLEDDLIPLLFGLTGDESQYQGSVVYFSTGATTETAAVLCTGDADQAAAAEQALGAWVDSQIEAVRNYQPAEVDKLEHAILETRGSTVLFVVAADWDKAAQAISKG